MKQQKNSRRSFIKSSTLAAGGVLTAPIPSDFMTPVWSNKKLKLALVGCGGRGSGAAVQALTADPDVELVAMADAFSDRLEGSLKAIQEHFDGEKDIKVKEQHRFVGFDAYKKAIDMADVVILATPPGFRPYHFEYAINNDKHVFMEKPVATDPVGIRKVLASAQLAKQKKLNVVVGLQRRYQQKYLSLLEQVQGGAIGKIRAGQVYWNDAGVWVRKREPGQTELEYQMRNWYYFNWLCGDHILEQHIHNIDVANWFIGEYPVEAQGMGGRQVRNGIDHGEIFDHHFVEFTYPGGAVISSQCRHQPGTMSRVDEVFQGTKGSITLGSGLIQDLENKTLFQYPGKWGEDPNPYQVEHDRLFASIRNGGVIADAENAAKSTLTAIMGRMATYSGKKVSWEQALNANYQLVPESMSWESTPPVLPDEEGRYAIPQPGKTTFE
ncbi:Gfo/Idh/MocA family protein [Lentiprolixibacter aurantiacus]|uniref:Gfo/Idh/MocA family oxidoreductase n=1 Tax=Lentiprolixibacter aurantiacus TaxID=2993939 RepID=A0AAE3MJX0_9FLAO|nr:Gfo/Idh/MocA family oxidoreductase [Lentiprolixibacter aurantiacus]MCX2718783.1 Gfo/Idh/MocA family oxidoreductase [Lentiprolixibacter aurantiacus]